MTKIMLALIALTTTAYANPRALPFTYTTDTLAPGQVEFEQTVDLTPLNGITANGTRGAYLASQFLTEFEIGVADRLELALYLTFVPTVGANVLEPQSQAIMPEGNGSKQRIRYTLADPGVWPIDVGVYGELSENEHEFEFEGKVLLQRRFGNLRVAANLWAEYELYFARQADGSIQRDVVLNPTLGATYEITPKLSVGVDSWLRGEYPTNQYMAPATRPFALGPEYYVGPAIMMSFGKIWWTAAMYVRATDFDETPPVGSYFGRVWFRSMFGYNL
ncbi:MAG TPA: hypothetical protein VH143_13210 [Kofleriaceae bacterium]|jgi:hypothetical protein|nr:hypothetical protein [Kofleriaceae bacterium]